MIRKIRCSSIVTFLFFGLLFCLLTAGVRPNKSNRRCPELTSVHIVDRNGLSETISNKERLIQFQSVDFLKSQPYQKVLRIYSRDSIGNIRSVVTTYYENGNPKQFLEVINGRASGNYREWHENGVMSISAYIIGGTPDVTACAEKTWLFDGPSCAWNEDGNLEAKITYAQGSLEGISLYYHPCGRIWKKIPYCKNVVEGTVEFFDNTGQLVREMTYVDGKKHGIAVRYWTPDQIASRECYDSGNLREAEYFDLDQNKVAEIKNGTGYRAVFGKDRIVELQEFQNGGPEGEVKFFNRTGCLKRTYRIKNCIKHGEEVEYYDPICPSAPLLPKFSFFWYEGKIQGVMRSWYPDGTPESQREMAGNAKNGILSAWYRDGSMMMLEEYESNKLLKGEYFRRGERFPVSQVIKGNGTAYIFDSAGNFMQKIQYLNGRPGQ